MQPRRRSGSACLRRASRCKPLLEMWRQADEAGATGEVRWSILRTVPGEMREGRIQYVYPHAPDLSWPPDALRHPNGATALTGVLICTDDPAEARSRFATFVGRSAQSGRMDLARGLLSIQDGAECKRIIPDFSAPTLPFISAIAISVDDLDAAKALLARNYVPIAEERDGGVWLSPNYGLGSYMFFHERRVAPLGRRKRTQTPA